jgi:hypothetical protein
VLTELLTVCAPKIKDKQFMPYRFVVNKTVSPETACGDLVEQYIAPCLGPGFNLEIETQQLMQQVHG